MRRVQAYVYRTYITYVYGTTQLHYSIYRTSKVHIIKQVYFIFSCIFYYLEFLIFPFSYRPAILYIYVLMLSTYIYKCTYEYLFLYVHFSQNHPSFNVHRRVLCISAI